MELQSCLKLNDSGTHGAINGPMAESAWALAYMHTLPRGKPEPMAINRHSDCRIGDTNSTIQVDLR